VPQSRPRTGNEETIPPCSREKPIGSWVEQAVQRFQLAAEVRPTSCSDLYDLLASLAEQTPPPRTHLDIVCARYLMHSACIRFATPMGDVLSRVDASLGWSSIWAALKLISEERWPRLSTELRALAARHRRVQSLPRRVEAHLKVHFAQTCRLPDVARGAGASIRVMTETFKREHGCTVHQYVSHLRLRAAVRLLTESEMKITAICKSVGWNSQADFYRHLRRFAALSPGAVRLDTSGVSVVLNRLDEWLGSHGLTA
jgi:AraC-like DNA-binding protein